MFRHQNQENSQHIEPESWKHILLQVFSFIWNVKDNPDINWGKTVVKSMNSLIYILISVADPGEGRAGHALPLPRPCKIKS